MAYERFVRLRPPDRVMTPILYSMATFRMLFADIYHYVGCSDATTGMLLRCKGFKVI